MASRWFILAVLSLLLTQSESAPQAFKRDTGHPQWHHRAFHDVRDAVRSDVRRMLHSRAEVPFQVPLEVNVVLIGISGDGGYRYNIDAHRIDWNNFSKPAFRLTDRLVWRLRSYYFSPSNPDFFF